MWKVCNKLKWGKCAAVSYFNSALPFHKSYLYLSMKNISNFIPGHDINRSVIKGD